MFPWSFTTTSLRNPCLPKGPFRWWTLSLSLSTSPISVFKIVVSTFLSSQLLSKYRRECHKKTVNKRVLPFRLLYANLLVPPTPEVYRHEYLSTIPSSYPVSIPHPPTPNSTLSGRPDGEVKELNEGWDGGWGRTQTRPGPETSYFQWHRNRGNRTHQNYYTGFSPDISLSLLCTWPR